MSDRSTAIAHARDAFDSGRFQDVLAKLIAVPSTSQDPDRAADVATYLDAHIRP
jgi:hypothetical protein